MRALLAPGGQLLADSFDLRFGAEPERAAELARKQAGERYFGEMDLVFEYKGARSTPFPVLHVDYETLRHVAAQAGWACELLRRRGGHYLVRARPT
jgi:hypothetical protein